MEVIYLGVLVIECFIMVFVIMWLHGMTMALWRGAPFVPTRSKDIRTILDAVHLRPGMRFLELGCGDGRVVCEAVARYGVRGEGVDVGILWLTFARIRARLMGISDRVIFRHQDILSTDLSQADVIYLYMMPRFLQKYSEHIVSHAKPGAIILSHVFELEKGDTTLQTLHPIDTSRSVTHHYQR